MKKYNQALQGFLDKNFTDSDLNEYMSLMYQRSWPFYDKKEQLKRMNLRILFGGTGISSYTLEALVRDSFLSLAFSDGDRFENTNKNRQNCTDNTVGEFKVKALYERVLSINSRGNYLPIADFLRPDNISELLKNFDVFVNSIDFDSPAFLSSHSICKEEAKIELFPFVIGSIAVLIVFDKKSDTFEKYFNTSDTFELKNLIIKHCFQQMELALPPDVFSSISKVLDIYYSNVENFVSDPQCISGVLKQASLVTDVLGKIARGEGLRSFPECYLCY